MREALAARSGRDFTAVSAPRQARSRRPSTDVSLAGRLLRTALAYPGRIAGGLVFAGCAGLIMVNALSFQTARHPAPLFGERDLRRPVAAAAPAARQPVARVAPQAPASEPVLAPLPPTRPADSAATSKTAQRDPIADLLRTGSTPGAPPALVPADGDARIAAAQRALDKLGYGPLTADGRTGPMTRGAIERFERDRGLPVTGEVAGRTLRDLAIRSGIAIE